MIGREFDLPTLARVAGIDPDDLLDVVEPAQVAGLVREDSIDRFRFSHALVRDTLVAAMAPSRAARLHARVAEVLRGVRGRQTEEARHWLAAGPSYARAGVAGRRSRRPRWPASSTPTRRPPSCCARRSAPWTHDPDVTLRQRYDVLLLLIDAYRWSAMWPELTGTVEQAVAVAEKLDDPELVASAAIATTQGALWQSAPHGEVHEGVLRALRYSLDRLPPQDGALRCRALLGLANELYYGADVRGTAGAGRRGPRDGPAARRRRAASWTPARSRSCRCGRPGPPRSDWPSPRRRSSWRARTGNERATVVSGTLRAVALGELGRPQEMWAAVDVARAEAERQRMLYGLMVLDSLVLPVAGDGRGVRASATGSSTASAGSTPRSRWSSRRTPPPAR